MEVINNQFGSLVQAYWGLIDSFKNDLRSPGGRYGLTTIERHKLK